jgi:putative transposase
VGALGIDGEGNKHPLSLVEGATENAAVVQALIDNLIERGLDPRVCRLFIVDGAKALTKVLRSTFGRHTPIQRCQIHKARNVIERLPKPLHASVRKALRQAWESTTRTRPGGCCAIWPAGSSKRRPALLPVSSKGLTRC